jgi:PiT family inorganic phosphate transporter
VVITWTLVAVIVLVIGWLAFEFTNGCHDTAHACATVVASGSLTYNQAVVMSGVANAFGALISVKFGGAAVAMFVTKVVHADAVSLHLIFAALVPGVLWNIWTAFKGHPVSSTHCLLSSLIGAGVAAAGLGAVAWHELGTALMYLFLAPVIGYVLSWLVAVTTVRFFGKPGTNAKLEKALPKVQIASSFAVSFAHGNNDGQKVMGIIMMILACAYPLQFTTSHVEWWVVALCALSIGIGTMIGAGPTMQTVGHKMSGKQITSYDGSIVEFVTASLIFVGGRFGMPLSTTQTCTGSILGAAQGVHGAGAQWGTVKKVIRSWLLTFIVCPPVAYLAYVIVKAIF